MPTSYSPLLGLALPVTGELSGTWGDTVNDYITKYLDSSVAGTQTISGSQTAVTLSVTNGTTLVQVGSGATGSAQYQVINCTGNPASLLTVTVPAQSKTYVVVNATSTSQQVKVVGVGPTTGVTLVAGEKAVIAWNGSDFIKVATSTVDGVSTISFGTTGLTPSTATSGAVTVAGTLVAANGGTGQSTYTTGDLLYATGSTALSKLGIGTNGQVLTSTGTAPQWSTLSGVAVTTFSAGTTGFTPSSATSGAVTLAGTLATTNGGTGLTSFTANGVVYASSTSALTTGSDVVYTGNFGIGTSSPTYKLNVVSGAGAQNIFQAGQSGVSNGYTITSDGTNLTYQWFTPSTEAMRLTSTGLGIGTSSPAYKLQVVGGNANGFLLDNGGQQYTQLLIQRNGTINTGGDILVDGSAGTFNIRSLLAGPMIFHTSPTAGSPTERMRLDASGNLGLGVTPSAWQSTRKALQIGNTGSLVSSSSNTIVGDNWYVDSGGTDRYLATGLLATVYQQTSGVHRWFTAGSGTAGNTISFTQAMTLDASGNLGIGTSSPATKLHLYTPAAATTLTIDSGTSGTAIAYSLAGVAKYTAEYVSGSNFYSIGRSGVAYDFVLSGGNVGIGTTSPGGFYGKLTVAGGIRTLDDNSSKLELGRYSAGVPNSYIKLGTNSNSLRFTNAADLADLLELTNSGNLGLGVTPSAWVSTWRAFQVGGSSGHGGSVYTNAGGTTGQIGVGQNWYFNGSNNLYITSAAASDYYQFGGAHVWRTAGSGTAGNAISFTQAMTLTAAGDLGVGTTSPGSKLDVSGNVNASNYQILGSVASQAGTFGFLNSNGPAIEVWGSSSANAGAMLFKTAGSERARIDSSGNLGLGVTPSGWSSVFKTLDISSSTSFYSQTNDPASGGVACNYYFNSSGSSIYKNTGFATNYYQTAGQHRWYTAPSGTAGNPISFTQAMTLDASGRLLVGLTSGISSWASGGQQQIQIAASGIQFPGLSTYAFSSTANSGGMVVLGRSASNTVGTLSQTSNGDSLGYLIFEGVNSSNSLVGGAYIQATQTGVAGGTYLPAALRFYTSDGTGPGERARITSGGELLVGTTTTQTGVAGDAVGITLYGATATGAGVFVRNGVPLYVNNKNANGALIQFYCNGNTVGDISSNGTGTSYNTASDYRLKNNQQPLTGSGAFIDALKPKTWNWATDGSKGVGFIAHEVQEVSPGSVVGTKDAVDKEGKPIMQAMEYGSAEFIANIIAELQSLRARVAQLEAK